MCGRYCSHIFIFIYEYNLTYMEDITKYLNEDAFPLNTIGMGDVTIGPGNFLSEPIGAPVYNKPGSFNAKTTSHDHVETNKKNREKRTKYLKPLKQYIKQKINS